MDFLLDFLEGMQDFRVVGNPFGKNFHIRTLFYGTKMPLLKYIPKEAVIITKF